MQNDPGGAHAIALANLYNGLKHGDPDLHGKRQAASDTMRNYHAAMNRDGTTDEMQQNLNLIDPRNPPRPTLAQALAISQQGHGYGADFSYAECATNGLQLGRQHWYGHYTLVKKAGVAAIHKHNEWQMDHLPLPPRGSDYLSDKRVQGIFRPPAVPMPPRLLPNAIPRRRSMTSAPIVRVLQDDPTQVGCPCYCPDGTQAWNNYGGGCPDVQPPPDDSQTDQYAASASTVYIDPVPNPLGLDIDPLAASIYTVVTPDVQGGMQDGWVDRFTNWSNDMADAAAGKQLPKEDCNGLKVLGVVYGTAYNVCRLLCKFDWNNMSNSCICALTTALGGGAVAIAIVKYCM